jgi:hypothetical protein
VIASTNNQLKIIRGKEMKKFLFTCGVLLPLLFSKSSYAIDAKDLNWFASLGYEFGGETYAAFEYLNSGIIENANANNGMLLNVGVNIPNNAAKTFETQLALGYKFGGPVGVKSGVVWNSNPIELTEYYRLGDWRTGLGLTYHFNTHFIGQSTGEREEVFRLNRTLGYLASMMYSPVAQNYAMELRYTYLRPTFVDTPEKIFTGKVNASVFGMALHYRF